MAATGTQYMSASFYIPTMCVILILGTGCTKTPDASQTSSAPKKLTALPDDIGKAEVVQNCTACHTDKLIIQNRMPAKKWDETITWMQEKQNMWALKPEARKKIVAYLGKHFGVPKDPSQIVGNGDKSLPTPRANPIW